MSDITFVQGDTAPPITGALKDDDGAPFDLSPVATVKFQMRKLDDRRYTVDAEADIVGTVTEGNVSYDWDDNDLDVPGEYIGQWELTYLDGRIQTTHPANTITVRRQ